MTSNAHITPTRLLGLEEAVGAIRNEELRVDFERFLSQLEVVADGKVILSDPYALDVDRYRMKPSIEEWLASLSSTERHRLLLVSVLTQPFDASTLWPEDRERFIDSLGGRVCCVPPNPLSISESLGMIPLGVRTPEDRREALEDPGLARLMRALPRAAPIETIASELISGAPGMCSYQMWQVARWSEDWAVVYAVGNASDAEVFPRILGFCRRDDPERNFIALLAEGCGRFDIGFYNTYGAAYSNWELARQIVHVADDDEVSDWEAFGELMALPDKLRVAVLREEKRHGRGVLLERIRSILLSAEDLGLDGLSLAQLLSKAGGKPSLAAIERQMPIWEEALEEEAERDRAERQLGLRPF